MGKFVIGTNVRIRSDASWKVSNGNLNKRGVFVITGIASDIKTETVSPSATTVEPAYYFSCRDNSQLVDDEVFMEKFLLPALQRDVSVEAASDLNVSIMTGLAEDVIDKNGI